MRKDFFDVHCHAFNFSHPNLEVFIRRLKLTRYFILLGILFIAVMIISYPRFWPLLGGSWPAWLIWLIWGIALTAGTVLGAFIFSKKRNIMKLLSYMDGSLGEYLLRMENEIDKALKLGDQSSQYGKAVLTPLMMDFGSKERVPLPNVDMRRMNHKPIAEQTHDLFVGIRDYCKLTNRNSLLIFPFLGVNTNNYHLENDPDGRVTLKQLMERYFKGMRAEESAAERRENLEKAMGLFQCDVRTLPEYSFAGIKVYPPMGFDPWPTDPAQQKKVKYLYRFCIERRIPITSHCSGNGFLFNRRNIEFSRPERWEAVLANDEFKSLTLNLAHMGGDYSSWREKAIALAMKYPNVYADFSNRGTSLCYYFKLRRILDKNPGLENKVLFGSDFMVNLLGVESYRKYLEYFLEERGCCGGHPLSAERKNLLCSENPARFLFGPQ
jgi:predicted TIM-barrel fold metal-dependent hydrolase